LALIRLAELHQERKEQHLVERHLNMFLKRFPSHEYAPTARNLLQAMTRRLQEAQYVLVALLPLSGKLSQFGTEALRGIQLSIEKGKEEFNLPSLELAIKDSESEKLFIRSALSTLINDFHPLAIIGPMASRQVQTLAELAERTQTPFLTPTATIPNVRRFGNFMFSTALTYQLQTNQLIHFAMDRAHFNRMAILHPNTVYGKSLSRLFSQEVQQRGGEIIAVETYEEKDTDFGAQIKRLKAEDLARYGTLTEEKGKEGESRPIYTPGFDALFIPGRAREVALITAQLVFFDIKVPLLGTNGWNAPSLLRLADRSIDGSVFVEGFFVGSTNPDTQDFIDRYKKRFHHDPSPFAAQAYEATQVVLQGVHQGATSAQDVQQYLINSNSLPTLGGTANFNAQGILNRPLHLLQIRNGKIVPAQDPVPTPELVP
jgi:ABC-type branched-subunit amino acid transport system substrate-binding protein